MPQTENDSAQIDDVAKECLALGIADELAPDADVMLGMRELEVRLRRSYIESTLALVAAVEARDTFTRRHSLRVERFCRCIARELGLSREQTEQIATAARLHDIGKIGVPDAILNKPGPLTDDEFKLIKQHPRTGVDILSHTTHLRSELPLILHHHERIDGGGYPRGLDGDDIPFGARVLTVADALDTMLTRRSYKQRMSLRRAKMELVYCRSRQFDADVVDATLSWLDNPRDFTATNLRDRRTRSQDAQAPRSDCE